MSATPSGPHSGYVPDLDQKLEYLIIERGDRRPKARREFDVADQGTLAAALGVNSSQLTRWRQDSRIPRLAFYTPKIAEIFDCDGQSFRIDDYLTFRTKCEANQTTWGRLVHGARVALDAIRPAGWQGRAVGLEGDPLVERDNLPIVAPGQGFCVEFESPRNAQGKALWAGWHVLMFAGDRDGYLNWMPRYKTTPEFAGIERFPSHLISIVVPRPGGRPLTAGSRAWGEHDVVLVASRDRISPELEAALAEPVANAALEPNLNLLAGWLALRMAKPVPEAALIRGPFFVGSLQATQRNR